MPTWGSMIVHLTFVMTFSIIHVSSHGGVYLHHQVVRLSTDGQCCIIPGESLEGSSQSKGHRQSRLQFVPA